MNIADLSRPIERAQPRQIDTSIAAEPVRPTRRPRLDYLDALKVALIVLLIAHHAGQSFAPTGGAWPVYNDERAPILDLFFTVNAAFFMGLFFLISGYFVPAAFDRKGPVSFLKDRFVRLGTPILVIVLLGLVIGFVQYVVLGGAAVWDTLIGTLSVVVFDMHFLHLWFLDLLLVFTTLYVVWRLLTERLSFGVPPLPRDAAIVGFALALALVTFMVRLAYPVNQWFVVLGFITTELAHLPQYASMFVIGLLAYRGQWVRDMPKRRGMLWLAIGVGLSLPELVHSIGPNDGFTLAALIKNVWESSVCVSLCLGLIVLFREYVATPGRVLRLAAPNAYGAYIVQLFVILPIQMAVIPLPFAPLLKFAVVTALATPVSFGLAALLRRLPGARSVL